MTVDERQTAETLAEMRSEIAEMASALRLSAATGGAMVQLAPFACIHVAAALDRGVNQGRPVATRVAPPPGALDPVTVLWLRLSLALSAACAADTLLTPAARVLAGWLHG